MEVVEEKRFSASEMMDELAWRPCQNLNAVGRNLARRVRQLPGFFAWRKSRVPIVDP